MNPSSTRPVMSPWNLACIVTALFFVVVAAVNGVPSIGVAAEDDYTEETKLDSEGRTIVQPRIVIQQQGVINQEDAIEQEIIVKQVIGGKQVIVRQGQQFIVRQPGQAVVMINVRAGNRRVDEFNQWVFGPHFPARPSFDSVIDEKVREVMTNYDLTDEEQGKLLLSSRADKTRFDHDVEELRRRYEAAVTNPDDLIVIREEARKLQQKQKNPLGRDSFFAKMANRIIAGKSSNIHSTKHKVGSSELLRHRHQANVEDAVRAFERFVEFRGTQRQELVELLLRETRPPHVFGDFDDIIVKYRLSQIPDAKWTPLFDADQWPKVLGALESFREFGPFLKRHGLLVEEQATSTVQKKLDLPADASRPDQLIEKSAPANPGEN